MGALRAAITSARYQFDVAAAPQRPPCGKRLPCLRASRDCRSAPAPRWWNVLPARNRDLGDAPIDARRRSSRRGVNSPCTSNARRPNTRARALSRPVATTPTMMDGVREGASSFGSAGDVRPARAASALSSLGPVRWHIHFSFLRLGIRLQIRHGYARVTKSA